MLFNCLVITLFANCIMYSTAGYLTVGFTPNPGLNGLGYTECTFEKTDYRSVTLNTAKKVGYIIPWQTFLAKFKIASNLKHPLNGQGTWKTCEKLRSEFELLNVEVDGSVYGRERTKEDTQTNYVGVVSDKEPNKDFRELLFRNDNGTGQQYFYTKGYLY